jgi:hypothetical protein
MAGALLPATAAMVITVWRAIVTRAVVAGAIHDWTFNHISWLVINRWWWRRVINRCGRRINRCRGCVNRSRCSINRTGSHCCANHAADDCANDRSPTPAWAAAMGFSLTCEGEGT